MSLKVIVKNAKNLPNISDEDGLLDPYVTVKFRGLKKRTEVIDDNLNPHWNEILEWKLKSPLVPNEEIHIEICDRLFLGRERLIGEMNYIVADLLNQEPHHESLRLKPMHKNIKKDDWEKTRLNMEFQYQLQPTASIVKGSTSALPFQVHVYVFEGRQLEGGIHITPAVTVTCHNKSLTTVAKPETNNPIYNELKTFYFNIIQDKLFSEEITITVFDEDRKQKHTIGSFAINIGTVYEELDHTLYNKWLVLGDPLDALGGAKGFLNVSISVIGPNDSQIHLTNEGIIGQDIDIESNVLQPVNVSLQPATMIVRFYHAQDIPQVDPSTLSEAIRSIFTGKATTEAADPYVVVSFNGQSRYTSVQKHNQHPVWNEQVNITYRFPSVCNTIVLQIKDKDNFFSSDDYIGTHCINIPDISVHGQNGFLPSFGPCYVNVYGSPREGYSVFPDKFEAMNKGEMKGVSYRGRLLMEIDTQLGVSATKHLQTIPEEARDKVNKYVGHSRDYVLFVVFNAASMIPKKLKDIHFEVSIGTYYQRIDVHELTEDGVRYHAVNWNNKKPLLEFVSSWEDCSDRINSLNILLSYQQELEACLANAKYYMADTEEDLKDICQRVQGELQKLLQSCHHTLLNMAHVRSTSTKLDKNLRSHRLDEISNMIAILSTSQWSPVKFTMLIDRFKKLTTDPQISIPDVVVWLMSQRHKVGYCRIPAHTIMYSEVTAMSGRNYGMLQTLQLKTPRSARVKSREADSSCYVEMALALGFKEHYELYRKNTLYELYGSSFIMSQRGLQKEVTLNSLSNKYELRAYVHLARDLISGDSTGLSDPYCVVSCCGSTSETKIVSATITPKWSQTVTLNSILSYIRPETLSDREGSPVVVVIQLFDKDSFGEDDYLGTAVVRPVVRMDNSSPYATLQWHPITCLDEPSGELLAAFELVKVDGEDSVTEELKDDGSIPTRLLPQTTTKLVKVQCLGLREMLNYHFMRVTNPFISIECDEHVRKTGVLNKGRVMFPDRNIAMAIELPVNELYAPPLNIFVYDKRMYGHTPLVGSHSISALRSMEDRLVDGKQLFRVSNPVVVHNMKIKGKLKYKSKFDWWSKYYASVGYNSRVQEDYPSGDSAHRLTVYPDELENSFGQFTDIVETYPLYSGKGKHSDKTTPVGYFKGIVSVDNEGASPNVTGLQPSVGDGIPNIYPQKLLVRVYVVKGINLKPCDHFKGESDPFLEVTCGSHHVSNVKEYISNCSNPLFGKVFELEAELPTDYKLTVTVKDHDHLIKNDTIGSTVIDLENRYLSAHRCLIGIPRSFSTSGVHTWHDFMTPVDILATICSMKGISVDWSEDHNTVTINGHAYHLENYESTEYQDGNNPHRLATHVLQQQNLVPEHIETRTLYRDDQHNVPQGQLHMWVDIIPRIEGVTTVPPLVNISPRQPKEYVLRIVLWKVTNIEQHPKQLTGDYYVTSTLNSGKTQTTDTHYFAFGGEGDFNWRFVHSFKYDPFTNKIVHAEKEHFYSLDTTEHLVDDKISFQVWDKDFFSPNQSKGKLEFSLHKAPRPVSSSEECSLITLDSHVDLFDEEKVNTTVKGWLPVYKADGRNGKECTGKMNVWIELLTAGKAAHHPAGAGRDDPNHHPTLEKPPRPLLKFSYFSSSLKTFKFRIWKRHKRTIILIVVCIVIAVIAWKII